MNIKAAIDISTFIWSQEDFDNNRNRYFELVKIMPTFYKKTKDFKIPLLFRDELYNLIITDFPYTMARHISYDYERLTLSFFIETFSNWIYYPDNADASVTSTPATVKPHFSNSTKTETQSQVCHLYHNGQDHEYRYLAYCYFFNSEDNLLLNRQQDECEIETFCYQSEKEISDFIDEHKIKFKHNPKHDKYKAGGKISPLSCYNERLGDTKRAQELLETAFLYKGDYYNFNQDVYVVFVTSNDGTYHGFDLSDEGDNVPMEVKQKFNKNGRQF